MKREEIKTYLKVTKTATYSFLIVLPLFLLYETLILAINEGHLQQVRVGADVWMKQVFALFGVHGTFYTTLVILLVGALILYWERKQKLPFKPKYFGGMILESIVYAIVFGFFVSYVIGMLFLAAPVSLTGIVFQNIPTTEGMGMGTQLTLSLGAGLYEELVFRVLLVGGLYWVLKRIFPGNKRAYVIAAVLGALCFSAVHYIGALGDPFAWSSFTYRFMFGLLLNALFLMRGFGVAAWTHALYDVMVVSHLF